MQRVYPVPAGVSTLPDTKAVPLETVLLALTFPTEDLSVSIMLEHEEVLLRLEQILNDELGTDDLVLRRLNPSGVEALEDGLVA